MLHAGVLVCPAAAPRRTLTVIITLQTHQLPMTQIVDGVIANAFNYKQQFGERVQELLDPAIDPRERGHLRVAFTLMCVFSFV